MSGFFKAVGIIFLLLLAVFFLGPRPDTSQAVRMDLAAIGDDLDGYLAASEASFDDIRDGLQKEIIWADPATKTPTEYSIAYIHGFSASRSEISPVSEQVAQELGANLFFTRIAGHGRTGAAMAEPKMSDWLEDMAEAISIGSKIGEKLILISASTGGTLSTWAAAHPEYAEKIAGMIMVSPNYAIHGASTGLLNMPWAEKLLPLIFGKERSFEPVNEAHGAGWTSSYPSTAVFPMAALLRVVEQIDKSRISTPAFFIFSPNDKVVVSSAIREVASAWGGPTKTLEITDSDDPYQHVIAGDALSPNTTGRVAGEMVSWIRGL